MVNSNLQIDNIELLRDEAQRLLRLNIEGLEQMMLAKGVITEAKEGSQQTFDRTSTPKYIEVLKGELAKLENMELVIAVVGTMKAGKSTTINAIVGTEVLPNRNRPMTALPTLIRHTPGQIEPILTFENNEPINVLFESIRQHIATGKVNEVLKNLSDDSDMKELIGNITSKQNFGQSYQGAENIFWCLKTLNDLVRLSSTLGVDFPFSSYSNVDQMPVITVEFAHLREAGKTHGQLTLLDTPGPNEAGQNHLRDMLTEQLKKTSAVLAVFDYTQLKSDADEQVRNEIKNIAQLHRGRLFALVNKFDQKDRNGDGKEAVQALVADKLMDGLLEKRHVFPVSSNWGYLANRASNEISINGKLPDSIKVPWVSDFRKAAATSCADDEIPDIPAVLKNPNILWNKSGFHEPMENVIRAAHTKAALLSIDSAAEKLLKCTNDVENFLGARRGALSQSVESLQQRIIGLKSNIETIEKKGSDIQKDIESILYNLNSKIDEGIEKVKSEVDEKIKEYFETGRHEESEAIKAEKEKRQQERNSRPLAPVGDKVGAVVTKVIDVSGLKKEDASKKESDSEKKPDFNSGEKIITFSNKNDADQKISKIKETIESIVKEQGKYLESYTRTELDEFRKKFNEAVESAQSLVNSINSSLASDGFRVNLHVSNKVNLDEVLDNSGLLLDVQSASQVKTETYIQKRDGWWASFTHWMNSDWGVDQHQREVKEFVVDLDKISDAMKKIIDQIFSDFSKRNECEVIEPLKSKTETFFKDLQTKIDSIRGDLQQGIRDQQNDKAELDILLGYLDQFLNNIVDVAKDCKSLNCDVNRLKNAKVAA